VEGSKICLPDRHKEKQRAGDLQKRNPEDKSYKQGMRNSREGVFMITQDLKA
jgi:hypothetical protein